MPIRCEGYFRKVVVHVGSQPIIRSKMGWSTEPNAFKLYEVALEGVRVGLRSRLQISTKGYNFDAVRREELDVILDGYQSYISPISVPY